MYNIDYAIWQEMVEYVVYEYAPLFSILHEAARELPLSRTLIDDLKASGELTVSCEPFRISLQIDPINDNIGGFRIYLMASIELSAMKELMSEVADDQGISQEEIDAFEVEQGLDMLGDIFEEIRDGYDIHPEIKGDDIIFSLLVFDSQDIDDSKGNDIFWSNEVYTN